MEKKVRFVTMGEIMLRMTRPDYQRIIQGNKIDGFYGGSEANVAVSLAMMGDDVQYVTRLPNNMLGVACRNELRRYQVGTDHIIWGGSRVGKYFYEQAASLRGSSIAYDRERSSMMTLHPHMIDWKEILKEADVFHWTGITCGLSEGASDATLTDWTRHCDKVCLSPVISTIVKTFGNTDKRLVTFCSLHSRRAILFLATQENGNS